MIDYAGNPNYGANISLVDTTDPVLGGIDGEANAASKGLADRTAFLKQILDGMVGAVQYFATAAAPTGWLQADGSRLDRTTYQTLFNSIGIRFGQRFIAGGGATDFTSVQRIDPATIDPHGFATEQAVNVENTNENSTATIQFSGVDILPTDTVYIRAIDADSFSLHPTASDATNNLNAATQNAFDGLEAFVVELADKITVPDLSNAVPSGVNSAIPADYVGAQARLETAVGASKYSTLQLLPCIKA